LITNGPQKYVRHPLYFGLMVIVFGWGLCTDITYYLFATIVLAVVQLNFDSFEEKELISLFGDQYRRYMEKTPLLVPFTKHKT
jgi:methanethiol S-methyltransferase